MYSKRCPKCGSYLDPGESCDCQEEKKNAAPGGANTGKRQRYELTGIITPTKGKINAKHYA